DLGWAERAAQVEELLRDQRLDRRGVEGAPAVRQRGEVGARGDQALARSGGGGQDDVRPRHDLDERFLLVRVQRQPAPLGPPGAGVEDGVRVGRRGQQVGESHIVPWCVARVTIEVTRRLTAGRAATRKSPRRRTRKDGKYN